MEDILLEVETRMESAIENMEKRFINVRAGRANAQIVDPVMVSYYGTPTPLKQLATISVPEARQLMINPFDRSSLQAIEKGIYEANIGLTPNNNGEVIILNIPPLTEETRREYVKQVKAISEECKIDVFIDDSYKTCEQIAGLGIKTYMMDSRINKNLEEKNWKRVYSWKDFEKEMSILGQMS